MYHLMRQRGYYAYLRQYMRVDVDSSLQRNQADVRLIVDNPEGRTSHTRFNIDSSFVVIKHDGAERNRSVPKEVKLGGQLAFRDYTGRFRAAPIARYLFNKRSEEHTSELQSLMRNSYAVFCL